MSKLGVQRLLEREMTRQQFLGLSVAALASVIGITGLIEQLKTHAAAPYLSSEPESGALSGTAATLSDTAASGGKAVNFRGANNGGGIGVRHWKAGSFGDGSAVYRTNWQSQFGFYPQLWTVFEDFQNSWTAKASSITGKKGQWFTDGSSINVITVGLILSGTGTHSQAPNMPALHAAAEGSDTAYVPGLQAVAQAIKSVGLNIPSTVIRLGHEMNANWYPWGTRAADAMTQASNQAAYRGAWAKAVPAIKAICPNVLFELCYNVGQGQLAEHYPGDQYVDIVSMDMYDGYNGTATTTAKFIAAQRASGFAEIGALANQHGKKFAVAEWGVSSDNPFFIHAMHDALTALDTQYPHIVHHDSYEDAANSSHAFSKNPQSAAAYAAIWRITT